MIMQFKPPGETADANPAQELNQIVRTAQRACLFGAALNIALVLYSMFRFPTSWSFSLAGLAGQLATTGIMMVYALIGWFGSASMGRRDARILILGARFGLLIGAWFAVTMLVEYLVPHTSKQNEALAKLIFGTFFLLLAVAGSLGTLVTRRLGYGVLTAVWSALMGSLCWFFLMLTTYYAFLGTSYEQRFLEVDNVIADFERSGMHDLRAFVIQDYLGGGFFHSLLGPLLAIPLGALGGLVVKAVDHLQLVFPAGVTWWKDTPRAGPLRARGLPEEKPRPRLPKRPRR
jgi:hypothetical protein